MKDPSRFAHQSENLCTGIDFTGAMMAAGFTFGNLTFGAGDTAA